MADPPLPPITEQLWWVSPKLAGVRKPMAAELTALKAAGIGALVSLLSDDSNLDLYQQYPISYIWVPIIGGTAPNLEQLSTIQTFVNSQHQQGNAVAVHCSSGRRRTGTVLAALLIRQGLDYDQAVSQILTANPAVELRAAQLDFLKSLSVDTKSLF